MVSTLQRIGDDLGIHWAGNQTGCDDLDQRRETVEHPFDTIKQWMNQGAFLCEGWRRLRRVS
jgi:hypothetical protein